MNAPPLPPPPAIICPAQPATTTTQPMTRVQAFSVAQVLAAVIVFLIIRAFRR